jgi:hypothetical protein
MSSSANPALRALLAAASSSTASGSSAGHNASDRKRRTFIVSAKLAAVRNSLLMIACTRCQHHRIIPAVALQYRDDVWIGDLLPGCAASNAGRARTGRRLPPWRKKLC